MKEKVLKILQQVNGFISGQELSERLGVSRTAVWKAIRQLEEEGYEIEAVRNKGYCLRTEPDLLTERKLRQYLPKSRYEKTEAVAESISGAESTGGAESKGDEESTSDAGSHWAGCRIACLDEVDSTNNEAKRLAESGAPHGTLVISEVQTEGRGRMGRPWSSPRGSGIWMSLLARPALMPVQASGLTLVMALAVREAIASAAGLSCQIKWPNDIVADGKKICGILTEMSADPDRINHIVIGLGINVLDEAFPEDIRDVAASIYQLSGKSCVRAELAAEVLKQFESYYAKYVKYGDLREIREAYNASLINCGERVRVLDPAGEYTAIAKGIDDSGALHVDRNGQEIAVISGEVSVRGVYGYV